MITTNDVHGLQVLGDDKIKSLLTSCPLSSQDNFGLKEDNFTP